MANTLLTPTQATREALRILHQKLRFVGSISRQYDDSFAKKGAKIGTSLTIRLPNQYTVRTGATLTAQDTTEASTSLAVRKPDPWSVSRNCSNVISILVFLIACAPGYPAAATCPPSGDCPARSRACS